MSICFFLLLMIPVITFNREENVISGIDNRELTNNPFGSNYNADEGVDLTEGIENYLEDRIGFRDEMIYGYTMLHDKAFHQLVHPTYTYGKDGYVFFQAGENISYDVFHRVFADMVKEIQDYCESRDVPFLFVFNPAKTTLLSDQLADGINYRNDWVQGFKDDLDKLGVHYIDNSELLKEKLEQGEMVFNKQYDAGHWNDLGAFYGVNQILETMKIDVPGVHVNEKNEFEITDILKTSLPVSKFPIEETVPYFMEQCDVADLTELYDAEVKRDENYPYFLYTVNAERREQGSAKTLVFQGSYMNTCGYKFLENSLGEYIAVHDYQNVTDFDYYFNIFKPEYVVFEAAEYVFFNQYFSYDRMVNMELNPALSTFKGLPAASHSLSEIVLEAEAGDTLTVIKAAGLPEDTRYAYLLTGGEVFDLKKVEDGDRQWYEATIEKEKYLPDEITVEIIDKQGRFMTKYEK